MNKKEVLNFERNIYFVNINTYLPYYFKKGMIEIQFSIPKSNILKVINQIKNLQFKFKIFPFFFYFKKNGQSQKKIHF